jgi:hypothetical protein
VSKKGSLNSKTVLKKKEISYTSNCVLGTKEKGVLLNLVIFPKEVELKKFF